MKRLLFTLLIAFLTGCTLLPSGAPSAEAAIRTGVGELARRQSMQIITVPQIHQTQPFGDGVIAFVTFDALQNQQRQRIQQVMKVRQQGGRWQVESGSSTTVPDTTPGEQLELFYSGVMNGSPAWAAGLVRDPAITQVAVTFGDGTREVVPVENGAYLLVREGAADVTQAEGMDADGRVLQTRP